MHVWVIFNDCPCEFAEPSIHGVYATRKRAAEIIAYHRKKDEYKTQYWKILKFLVRN